MAEPESPRHFMNLEALGGRVGRKAGCGVSLLYDNLQLLIHKKTHRIKNHIAPAITPFFATPAGSDCFCFVRDKTSLSVRFMLFIMMSHERNLCIEWLGFRVKSVYK